MSNEKIVGFYSGIVFVFLIMFLLVGVSLGVLFFNDQINTCKKLGYDGMSGIDSCQKTVNYQTSQGNVEVKEKISLKTNVVMVG